MRMLATAGFMVCPERSKNEYKIRSVKQRARQPRIKHIEAQNGCPFLTRLPVEVRYIIYAYVFALGSEQYKKANPVINDSEIGDKNNPSDNLQVGCELLLRPRQQNEEQHRSNRVPLLQLCQLIHAEAEPLMISASTHYLIYPPVRALSFPIPTVARSYLAPMRRAQIAQIKSLHLFTGSNRLGCSSNVDSVTLETTKRKSRTDNFNGTYRSENPLAEIGAIRCGGVRKIDRLPLNLEHLTIIIRADDWSTRSRLIRNHGEYSLAHFLRNKYWGNVFYGLKTLSFELEIERTQKTLLQSTIADLKKFVFNIGDGEGLVPEDDVRELVYVGDPTTRSSYDVHGNIVATATDPVSYVVFKLSWRLQRSHEKAVVRD